LQGATYFAIPKGFAPNPNYFFAHEGLFFKGIRELASLGSLDQKSNQKSQEIPEAISCADQKTKAKKCPRLPLLLKSLSSFAGGNFGGRSFFSRLFHKQFCSYENCFGGNENR
jgi:hypothetical protein